MSLPKDSDPFKVAMLSASTPFDTLRHLIQNLPPLGMNAVEAVRRRDRRLTKPLGSLGRLEEIAEWIASVQNSERPAVTKPMVAIFAGNHGVVRHGVSPFPSEVTRQMVENFSARGAAINQICGTFDLALKVFELALDIPTQDITEDAALDEAACAATMAFGMEAIAGGIDLLVIGEMGIGNTTIAAALYHALYGGAPSDWVGRGTGVDDDGLNRKIDVVGRAVAFHRAHLHDPLEVLRRLGGREIAAMAGAILAARSQAIPVVLDGYVACSAAAILHRLDPSVLDHCIAGHVSAEGAHADVLRRLGKRPLLDLGMRLGEGSGGALAVAVIKAALACHSGMATFDQAGVSDRAEG